MKKKRGVITAGLQIEMRPVLILVENLWKALGKEAVITSALDGMHSAGSLHYYGYALDFRIWGIAKNDLSTIVANLQKELGSKYDVILHKTHIHVEYQEVLNNG